MDEQQFSFDSLRPINTPGHPQTVAIFEKLAEGFNVAVEPVHSNYWRSMLTVGRAIDSFVDTYKPSSIYSEALQLVQGLPIQGVTEEEAIEFSKIYHTVSLERQVAIQQGLSISDYAVAMRQANTYNDFIHLRVEEAEVFGNIMQLDNPDQQSTVEKFNNWLPKFARAGYLIDSFGDFSADYKEGTIGLQPSMGRRIKLGKRALSETFDAVSELPPRTISFLAVASLSKIVRNGLKQK